MARQMKKFAEGGSDKYDAKMRRKTEDIEKDYQKALKKGKNEGVAKAKYEQRMADAKDDYAKWTKADRTQTRAGEKAAEAALSEARRTKGLSTRVRDFAMSGGDEPLKTKIDTSLAGRVQTKRAAPKPAAKPAPKKTVADTAKQAVEQRAPTKKSYAKEAEAAGQAASSALGAVKSVFGGSKPPTAPSRQLSPAEKLERSAAERRKLEASPAGHNVGAKLRGMLGFGASADERSARNMREYAARQEANRAATAKRNAEEAAEAQARAAQRNREGRAKALAGNPMYKSYLDKDTGMNKGGSTKKYAKGGKIDGCAVRGKTRAR